MTHRIIEHEWLGPSTCRIVVTAPDIARVRQAGQFVILRINEKGERFPLTICDADPMQGTLSLVFQTVGKSTYHLARLRVSDTIQDITGPLGQPSRIQKYGTVVCIGGGIGIAPIYPIAAAMKSVGNRVISIIGARTKELLILESDMRKISDALRVCTDDGSYARKGFTSDLLKELIAEGVKIDLVVAIGPVPMMKVIADITRDQTIGTIVSLNPIMVDGTGMCGCCRVSVGGDTKFACVDGPEFDGHEVNFEELMHRLRTYLPQEKIALDTFIATVGIRGLHNNGG